MSAAGPTPEGQGIHRLRLDPSERNVAASRPWGWVLLVVAVAAGLGALALRAPPAPAETARPAERPVTTAAVPLTPAADTAAILASGRVQAPTRVDLFPGRSGVVANVLVKRGDKVERGALLAELDAAGEKADVASRQAALAVQQAKLASLEQGARSEDIEAARQLVRESEAALEAAKDQQSQDEELAARGMVAPVQRKSSRHGAEMAAARLGSMKARLAQLEAGTRAADLDAARAEVQRAAAELSAAQARVKSTRILAPAAGTILDVHLQPGEAVVLETGRPLLTLADLDHLVVKADVPEARAARLRAGMPAEVVVEALAPLSLPGVVQDVALEADRQKNTLEVVVALTQTDPRVRPNMNARVTITEPKEKP